MKQEYEKNLGVTSILLKHYFQYWKDEYFGKVRKLWVDVEGKFRVNPPELNGVPIVGRRDAIYDHDGQLVLLEHKTKSSWDDTNIAFLLLRDLQCMVYIKTFEIETGQRIDKIQYNLIKRPAIRLKQDESLTAFGKRLDETISENPQSYFAKIEMPVNWKTVNAQWELVMQDCKKYIEWYTKHDKDSEYTENCVTHFGECEFLQLCSGLTDIRIQKRDAPHIELK